MKKNARKLTLNRETLHNLTNSQLQGAAGAASIYNSCDPDSVRICPSQRCTYDC
jgi:exopolysaccharide biosynthesis protein